MDGDTPRSGGSRTPRTPVSRHATPRPAEAKPSLPRVVMRTPECDPWLFTAEEVAASPSRHYGVPEAFENEAYLRASIYQRECSVVLNIPALTTCVAATFLRRFFMLESITEHDMGHVAAACLFLACKVSETHKRLRDFIHHVVSVRTRDEISKEGEVVFEGSDLFDRERKAMLTKEAEVMRILNFDLTIDQPFKHVALLAEKYVNTLGLDKEVFGDDDRGESPGEQLAAAQKDAKQTAWNFLQESMGSYVYLRFDAREVSTAAIFLGASLANLATQSTEPGSPRYNDIFNCDVGHIEEICNALLDNAIVRPMGDDGVWSSQRFA